MNTKIIGRTLNKNGEPIEGTGVELNMEGPTFKLLATQENLIIFSNPVTSEYAASVDIKDENGNITTKGLGILPAGASGPPKHIHPSYEEEFEVVEGSAIFVLNNKEIIMHAGEKVIVPAGTAHTFRPHGKEFLSVLVEARPLGKLNEVVHTIFGLAHDGKLDKKGRPNFWQGIAFGSELSDDTVFTSPPPAIQRLIFKLFAKSAKKRGYKALYPEYMEDSFWKNRVEQLF